MSEPASKSKSHEHSHEQIHEQSHEQSRQYNGDSGAQPDGATLANRVVDSGQATAEYALVLLGAAAVALLLIGWATTTDQVSRLFDFVVDQVIGRSG
jgi:hypothetical protein